LASSLPRYRSDRDDAQQYVGPHIFMSSTSYYLFALFLAAVLLGQFISGKALGTWWFPRITRQDNPAAYWSVLAAQSAILIAFLVTGRTWHIR
jgi:hypothetical protein